MNKDQIAMFERKQRGFSLIELMIALVVLAVLLAIALPTFGSVIRSNRVAGQTNELIGVVNYARSEAVLRGVEVAVRPNDGMDWASGLSVIADVNRNDDFEVAERLRTVEAIGRATATATADLTFRASGRVKGGGEITLTFTAADCKTGEDNIRVLTITASGQVVMEKGTC